MFNFKIRSILFLSALFFLEGCATLLSPSKGPNVLNSEPSSAEVYDDNNVKLGSTPLDFSTLPEKIKLLHIKKEGYRDVELAVKRKSKNGIMFLDAMLLCLPCPVDFSGDKLYSFFPLNPNVKLRKKIAEKDNSIKVALDEFTLDVKKTSIGKINYTSKTVNDRGISRLFGSADESDDIAATAFDKSYLQVINLAWTESKSSLARPKILFKPVITDVNFELKGNAVRDYTGREDVTCKWNIYKMSDKDSVVASITTTTAVFRNIGSEAKILDQLIYETTLDLLENDTLYDFLMKLEKEYLSDSKGKELKINTSQASKYTTTKEALKNIKPAVVTVMSEDGFGSGSIITSDGYILSNYHVIKNEKNIMIKMSNDFKVKAQVVKSNKDYDLVLLRIEAEDLKTVPIGNSDLIESGDEVYAIGTPMETDLSQTITRGIISGERVIKGMKFIQTDVSINPGNSGGPLINDKGEMIGITTMKLAGEGIEGIGFCIPTNVAMEMLNIKF